MRPAGLFWVGLFVWVAALPASANPVLDWNTLLLNAIRADDTAPTLASRNLAILNTAMFDAANSIEKRYQPYRFMLPAPVGASTEAAIVGAAEKVSSLLYPQHQGTFDAALATYLNSVAPTKDVTNGFEFGRLIGQKSVDNRASDGSSTQVPYIPSRAPAQWRRTPPYFRPPTDPQWGYLEPFCLDNVDAFMPPGPPALASDAYAQDVNELKAIGGVNSTVRTAEQSTIARFWSDFSYTPTPPGHWMEIAQDVMASQGTSPLESARLGALLGLAQADVGIVVWRAKYHFNFWRPITAITRASEDGNSGTDPDPNWQPFLPTPSFPEYVSGHSTFSMASAVVLRNFYGTDSLSFSAHSDAMPGVIRRYNSLTSCADEVGISRIYGGIHFSSANRDGKACGAKIGQFVSENFLLPNQLLPLVRIPAEPGALSSVRAHGHIGSTLILDGSKDLSQWQPISTNRAVVAGVLVQLPTRSRPELRFFRVREN